MAFIAIGEAIVPSGSGLQVVTWRRAWRRKLGRGRRYAQVLAIALRHGLLSTRRRRRASNDDAERRALARSLCLALEDGGVRPSTRPASVARNAVRRAVRPGIATEAMGIQRPKADHDSLAHRQHARTP
jgi:hypothetical protein